MRLVGWSERALELMINRANSRTAFGKPLIAQGTILSNIAESRIEIEQARYVVPGFHSACKACKSSYEQKKACKSMRLFE